MELEAVAPGWLEALSKDLERVRELLDTTEQDLKKAQDRVVELERELAELRGDASDPEWDRIQKLSDDEVKAELIADGVYKDEAEIIEQGQKFTLRVHEMLRMLNSGKRQGAERVAELERENKRLLKGLAHIAETCVQDPETAQFASRLIDGSAETSQ